MAKSLTLESVELIGAVKTTPATVYRFLDLQPGAAVDQDGLWVAVDRLRRSGLFAAVEHYIRPGERRGGIVLVLEVEERGAELRFGTGNTDMDGWYVIPAELNLDNLRGHGERAGLRTRFGYRVFDMGLHYGRGGAPADRLAWTTDFSVGVREHVYFLDGVEYAHPVVRGGLGFAAERRLGGCWRLGASARFETVVVDSTGYVRRDAEWAGLHEGDDVLFDDLPDFVRDVVDENPETTLRLDLVRDGTGDARWADSPVQGVWGRLRLTRVERETGGHGGVDLDLRAYRRIGRGVGALRARAAAVGDAAPFHDRLYLGGLYTVRGFPSQGLAPAGGDTRVWHASAEYRTPLMGDPSLPRLAGLLFADAGRAGVADDASSSVGWGLRLRLGWLGWLGFDVAYPLTPSPLDESFRVHGSLGWSF